MCVCVHVCLRACPAPYLFLTLARSSISGAHFGDGGKLRFNNRSMFRVRRSYLENAFSDIMFNRFFMHM